MRILKIGFFLFCFGLGGCTSSSYGNSFVPVQNNAAEPSNQYTLKIYTGGFAGPEYAKKDLKIEAEKFMNENPRFKSYKIISEKFELIPSGVVFVVEFSEDS
jgi:hypothetical protein